MSKKTRRTRRMRNMLLVVSMMLVVAMASVGVTVAWLTAESDKNVNTFTTSGITIELKETMGTDTDTGKSFKMVPGNTIEKDPKVTVNKDSEACYLFVELIKSGNFDEYLTYAIADGWTALAGSEGVFYRTVGNLENETVLAEDKTFSVLKGDQVTVIDTVNKNDMTAAGITPPTLTVQAYACQLDNVTDPATAWNNINVQ